MAGVSREAFRSPAPKMMERDGIIGVSKRNVTARDNDGISAHARYEIEKEFPFGTQDPLMADGDNEAVSYSGDNMGRNNGREKYPKVTDKERASGAFLPK